MLTIKKHPLSLKAASLGAIAFLIGLSGAAMYIDRFRQHENLVFGQAEMVLGASNTRPAEQKSPADETQNTASSQAAASPDAVSTDLEIVPLSGAGSAPAAPSVATQALPTVAPPTPTPGMGAGPVNEPAPAPPNPIEAIQDSCLVNSCVQTTVEDATNSLLGQ